MEDDDPDRILLAPWGLRGAHARRVRGGKVNDTWLVEHEGTSHILQRVSPALDVALHADVDVVTRTLEEAGLTTPRLIPTLSGDLFARDTFGRAWRALSFVEGEVFDHSDSVEMCQESGRLLGRVHRALSTLKWEFRSTRPWVHDLGLRLSTMRETLMKKSGHPYIAAARGLAADLEALACSLENRNALTRGVVHGDPKIANIVFDASGSAMCFVDLDTFGRAGLIVDLGDAMRSWCASAAAVEAVHERAWSPEWYEGGLLGYAENMKGVIDRRDCEDLPRVVSKSAVELGCRYCEDVLNESYFKYDAELYERAAPHNLLRGSFQARVAGTVLAIRAKLSGVTREILA